MNELWIYCYFEYVNDDIVLNWHKYLIYVSGLVSSTGGTENKGLYVLVLSIGFAWKKLKFQHKTTPSIPHLKYMGQKV